MCIECSLLSSHTPIDGLIRTHDVEEKMRAKGTCGKGIVGASSANFVQKNNSHEKKKPQQNPTKTTQTTTFKKKKKGACYVCESRITLMLGVRTAKVAENLLTW
jgi:hypothetical protein